MSGIISAPEAKFRSRSMMNQSILVGYEPHCCMFKRKRKGGIYYHLQYQLPGGLRRTISLGRNKKEAEQRAACNALAELNNEMPPYPSD